MEIPYSPEVIREAIKLTDEDWELYRTVEESFKAHFFNETRDYGWSCEKSCMGPFWYNSFLTLTRELYPLQQKLLAKEQLANYTHKPKESSGEDSIDIPGIYSALLHRHFEPAAKFMKSGRYLRNSVPEQGIDCRLISLDAVAKLVQTTTRFILATDSNGYFLPSNIREAEEEIKQRNFVRINNPMRDGSRMNLEYAGRPASNAPEKDQMAWLLVNLPMTRYVHQILMKQQ